MPPRDSNDTRDLERTITEAWPRYGDEPWFDEEYWHEENEIRETVIWQTGQWPATRALRVVEGDIGSNSRIRIISLLEDWDLNDIHQAARQDEPEEMAYESQSD